MRRLLDGLQRYEHSKKSGYASRFAKLALNQSPPVMLLTCSDSRLVPNLFTSSGPGEIFFVRNIGNIVPAYDVDGDASVPAAILYGVDVLGVSDIVVCGHSDCGGMKALLAPPPRDPHLRRWLSYGTAAVTSFHERGAGEPSRALHDQLSQWSVLRQVENLSRYPCVRERLAQGTINLHAWWFDIASGSALAYSEADAAYIPAVDDLSSRLGDDESALHVA